MIYYQSKNPPAKLGISETFQDVNAGVTKMPKTVLFSREIGSKWRQPKWVVGRWRRSFED
jgi:hypothetical protein